MVISFLYGYFYSKEYKSGSIQISMNKLIVAASSDASMRYASGVDISEPFILLDTGKKRTIVVSALEFEDVRKKSKHEVVLMNEYYFALKDKKGSGLALIAAALLKEKRIKKIIMSHTSYASVVDTLREQEITVTLGELYPQRIIKTKEEISHIKKARNATIKALKHVIEIITKSDVQNGNLYFEGKKLRCEDLKTQARLLLLSLGYESTEIIISHSKQTGIPHHRGEGMIREGEPIVLDFFPRNIASGYWFDMTRTIVKGEATSEFTSLWNAVKKAQRMALAKVKAGVKVATIHKEVENVFSQLTYETKGQEGFIHSTGHGVGLEIHEAPHIGAKSKEILRAGMVITIEPGLYYRYGGARIEDTILVTKTGYEDLTKFPKIMRV